MKRSTLAIGIVALALAAVAVLVAVLMTRSEPQQPDTFGSWYPLVNEVGDPAVADFENHVPCTIDEPAVPECQRVKLGIVLYRDEAGEPTTYLISVIRVGVSDERETHEGTWTEGQGTGLDQDAETYLLDAGAPEHLRGYWPVGDDILFLLDENGMPKVGDAAYGYALNRIPVGQHVTTTPRP